MVTKSITEKGKRLFYFAVFLTLVLWLSTRSKPTFICLYTITPDRIQISAELTSIPIRLSYIWSSTRDNILRKLKFLPNMYTAMACSWTSVTIKHTYSCVSYLPVILPPIQDQLQTTTDSNLRTRIFQSGVL